MEHIPRAQPRMISCLRVGLYVLSISMFVLSIYIYIYMYLCTGDTRSLTRRERGIIGSAIVVNCVYLFIVYS